MAIVRESDFKDEYKIQGSTFSDLGTYIARYEKYYLVRLLGKELYDLFIADLAGTPQEPQTQRFIDIFNSFEIDDSNCLRVSEGIKTMLVQFIYFHYVRNLGHEVTVSGISRTKQATSEPELYTGYNLVEAYNRGIKNYEVIQWYICDNNDIYPEENTQYLQYTSGI